MSSQNWVRVIVGCVLLLAAAGAPVRAATTAVFNVNAFGETVDINPGNGVCADSGGLCTLKAAVMETNALAGADIINLTAGTFNLTATLPINDDLTINGVSAATTILDGPGLLGVKGFSVNANVDLALNNLTMRDYMAAIYISGNLSNTGTIVLQDCILRDNHSSDVANSGSAILNYCLGCEVTLRNTAVYDNSARACGAISNKGVLTIEQGSDIRDNQATYSTGGAICNRDGTLSILLSTIRYNSASGDSNNFGGAIEQAGGSTAISLSEIYNNSASDSGGAIYVNTGSLYINNSTISGNNAYSGGGLYLYGNDPANLSAVTIMGNSALFGGGILAGQNLTIAYADIISNTVSTNGGGLYITEKTVTILNSTLSGNQANQNGAGLYVTGSATLNLGNVTVKNNTADADANGAGMSGGIWSEGGTVLVRNSVIAQNHDLTASQFEIWAPDCYGAITSDGYNLFGFVNPLCSLSGDMSGVSFGSISPGIDPRLLPLTRDVYSTFHHPPQLGPVVDRGNPAGCKDFSGVLLTSDQRGEARIFGSGATNYLPRCDLGAVELSFALKSLFLPMVER